MAFDFDLPMVETGFVGSALAERCAAELGGRILEVERRERLDTPTMRTIATGS